MPIEVRQLVASDRAAWEPLWIGYQTFYKRKLSEEMIELSWHRFLDPTQPLDAYGAFDGERMVGLVHIAMQTLTSFRRPACYLSDLFTDESVRGKGIGRALIEHVYKIAKERDCERVFWLTHETNTAGRLLYDKVAERSGFIHYWKPL
ncbi:acetyltransferase GNAT family protein [Variibacter gotjawalensis]|uniref:Acetyltransferase GNAT family protein n=1 Tax=Variibacter gotjawalensis TaxID=1333996 RepID=A0A0S3PV01_9BRAD|nr:GNAT family N-acetyltransferase [Variibacter gotjawalensis]NIK50078.1 GNAT superfamily N-acetyltransferase [Variibacter gotjawalensis]RZS46077.1 ribosomal protein S18 acetylase RimI-like enzyme [Variibacter gotjawalensis]BAT59752.1 acetyltransferase GNAT family protein [Variibacter gotjawalensis]